MVARFPPFPPLQASLFEVWALLRAAIKTAELYVRTSPGYTRYSSIRLDASLPKKTASMQCLQRVSLRQVLIS